MRFRALSIVPFALLFWGPAAARGQEPVSPPVTPSPAEEYQDEYERERRERERRDREEQREQWGPSAAAQARRGEGIQVRAIPETDLTAVLHKVELDDEELLVRLRFYNDGTAPATLAIDPTGAYESFFIEIGGEKLHILRDDDGDLDAKDALEEELAPGEMESWWARFPAPVTSAETFELEIPPAPRFEDVPLEGK